jgi:hypothetical protein
MAARILRNAFLVLMKPFRWGAGAHASLACEVIKHAADRSELHPLALIHERNDLLARNFPDVPQFIDKGYRRSIETADGRSEVFQQPALQVLPGSVDVKDFDRMHFEFVVIEMDHRTAKRDRFHLHPCVQLRIDRPQHRPWH